MVTLRQVARRGAVAALVALVALPLVVHLPPVKRSVASWGAGRAGRALDARVSIGSLSYNLATLTVDARDVRISPLAAGSAPWFEAERVVADLPWRRLTGRHYESIEVWSPKLRLEELRQWLAARPDRGPGRRLERLEFQRVAIHDLELSGYARPAAFSIDVEGVSLDGSTQGGRLVAPVKATGGALRIDAFETALRGAEGTVAFDGQRLYLEPLRVTLPDAEIEARGDIRLLGESPAYNLDVRLAGAVGAVLSAWPAVPATNGQVQVTGRVTGPLGSPTAALEATAGELSFSGVPVTRVSARSRISGDGVVVEQVAFAVLGGQVEGRVTIPSGTGRPDEAHLTWRGVDLSSLLRHFDVPLRLVARSDGAATLNGTFAKPDTWVLDASSRLATGGTPNGVAGQARLGVRRGAWTLTLNRGRLGENGIQGSLSGRLAREPERLARSTLRGTVSVDTPDVGLLIRSLADAGVSVPAGVRTLTSAPTSVELALGGTLSRPALSTQFPGTEVTYAGRGTLRIEGPLSFSEASRLSTDGLSLSLATGSLRLAGSADLRGPLALEIDAVDLPVASVARLLDLSGYLPTGGVATLQGRVGGTTRQPAAQLRVRADGIEWLGQRLDTLSGPVAIEGRLVSTDRLDIAAGEGTATLRGRVDFAHDTFEGEVSATRFPVTPLRLPDSRDGSATVDLSGTVDLAISARGPIASPAGSGTLAVHDLRYGRAHPGPVNATIVLDGSGSARADVQVAELATRLTASARVARPWAYEARANIDGLDVTRAAEHAGIAPETAADFTGTLTGHVDAAGELERPASSDVTVTLDRFEGTAFTLPVRVASAAVLHVDATEISTDGLEVLTGGTRARVQGRLALDASEGTLGLHAEGAAADLAPLLERTTGAKATASGTFVADVTASGTRNAPRLAGAIEVREGRIALEGRPPITGIALTGTLREGRLDLASARASVGEGTFEAHGALPVRLFDEWLPASVVAANPSSGPARVSATLRNVGVGSILALAGRPVAGDIDSSLDATAELSADRASLDALAGTVRIERVSSLVKDVAIAQDDVAVIHVANGVATFEEWRWKGARTDLALRGSIGFTARPVAYDIEVRGPVDVSVVGRHHPRPVRRGTFAQISGFARSTARRSSTARCSSRAGPGSTATCRSHSPTSPETSACSATDSWSMASQGRLNGGEVTVSGEMNRVAGGTGYSGAISLSGRRLTIEFPPSVVSEFDADVQLVSPGPRGSMFGIIGKSTVQPGPVRAVGPAARAHVRVRPAGAADARRRAPAEADGASRPRRPARDHGGHRRRQQRPQGADGGHRPAHGHARLARDDRPPRHPRGRRAVPRGSPLQPAGGQIEFTSQDRIEPRLNLRGETRVSDYQVELQLTGPVDRLDFRLRSNPPLSQGDLASLLTTGQTLKERQEATEQASDAARAQVLSAVSSEYLGAIGRWFGVDTVRIENSTRDLSAIDVDPVSRLSVTKKLGPNFTVVYSQSIETNDDIYWVVIYDPGWKKLEVSTKYTTQEGETAELRQELLLGAGTRPTNAARASRRSRNGARVTDVTVTGVPDAEAHAVRGRLSLSQGNRFDAYKWLRDRARVDRFYRDQDRLRTTRGRLAQPSADGAGT